jgi:TonB family protein
MIRKRLATVGLLSVILSMASTARASGVEVKVVTGDELWAYFDKKVYPIYPYEARQAHAEGAGLFRMYINPDGSVRTVAVMKSTGNKLLDLAAAGGLFHCHAKPRGHPFEIDMPVAFHLLR